MVFVVQAEYVSQDTLWDRVNDAVNTIIRRDESTETGDLLPPCIEGTYFFMKSHVSWTQL